jgi:hypothetical protein
VAFGFVHGTAETIGHVVVEHFDSAFAGAIDEIATARPATKIDAAFMADLLSRVFVNVTYNHRNRGSQPGKFKTGILAHNQNHAALPGLAPRSQ